MKKFINWLFEKEIIPVPEVKKLGPEDGMEYIKALEACQKDYSNWLSSISDQMPNKIFFKKRIEILNSLSVKHRLEFDLIYSHFLSYEERISI